MSKPWLRRIQIQAHSAKKANCYSFHQYKRTGCANSSMEETPDICSMLMYRGGKKVSLAYEDQEGFP
jgi:hypothetical protein